MQNLHEDQAAERTSVSELRASFVLVNGQITQLGDDGSPTRRVSR